MTVEEFREAPKLPVVIVLDNIRSQHNTGSVFRTADAFRAEAIYLCGFTATPPHREIHKTALGSTESVAWYYRETTRQAVEELKASGYAIIAVEQAEASVSLENYIPEPGRKIALIFGNEIDGVEDEVLAHAEACIEIPQFGTKHSINIAVAVGIVIWEVAVRMNFMKK
jgi:tRNA G18 (ribose-2'-O)-methylase SpoU